MAFLFEKLDVYQKGLTFAEEIRKFCRSLPSGNYDITDQLRRAAVSIPTNIAEGNGRWHEADKRHFLMIARGSAFECVPLLDLCLRTCSSKPEVIQRLRSDIEEICRMISGLIQRIEKKKKNKRGEKQLLK